MRNFRRFLLEDIVPAYDGDIKAISNLTNLSTLPELFPGFVPGCKVTGDFSCFGCSSLTSLEGAPSSVENNVFLRGSTSLRALSGGPSSVSVDFSCSGCTMLTSLQGAPLTIGGNFMCFRCVSLTSLQGIGKDYCLSVKGFYIDGCKNLTSHFLGLMLVKKLDVLSFDVNKDLEGIINRHLEGNKDLLDCKEELIRAGYKEYAKL
jgi:hypothetical protein